MIGILGGTFDPVHHGHLRLALEALEYFELTELRLVPLSAPPHRDPPVAPAAMRLHMLKAAVAGEARLRVDDRELQRGGISYTVETLQSLREDFCDTPISLILGMDAFNGLASWHEWQQLPALAHLLIARRPGAQMPTDPAVSKLLRELQVDDPRRLRDRPNGGLHVFELPALDISSSRIRAMIRDRRSPRFLLPDAVLDLIGKHQLYRPSTQAC